METVDTNRLDKTAENIENIVVIQNNNAKTGVRNKAKRSEIDLDNADGVKQKSDPELSNEEVILMG